jgi:hypothetical protein
VDFSLIYPDLSAAEIDLVQREPYEIAYRYEPFTGFGIAPTKRQMVEVTTAGFRTGHEPQPWPPDPNSINVFVFGGSTTFGYAVRGQDALPAALEKELRRIYPALRIECYNFGCGYYYSTQERLRFEQLLAYGRVPKLAIFVDGLNDFYCAHDLPEFSHHVAKVFPSVETLSPPIISTVEQARAAIDSMLDRYRANTLMLEALARQWNTGLVIIGQPIPFYELQRTDKTYPFSLPERDHGLAMFGYNRFRELALTKRFGPHFIWCGDAFATSRSVMYADSIHYSPEGNRILARLIVERAQAQGLLKL